MSVHVPDELAAQCLVGEVKIVGKQLVAFCSQNSSCHVFDKVVLQTCAIGLSASTFQAEELSLKRPEICKGVIVTFNLCAIVQVS